MKNQKTSATLLSYTFTAPRYKQAVYDRKGNLYGANIGTSVRPQIVPVNTSTGIESVAQFIARGGRILKGKTKTAKGVAKVHIRIASSGHNRTGSIVRAAIVPSGMRTSSLVSLANAQRPYNGSAMKTFGPRG